MNVIQLEPNEVKVIDVTIEKQGLLDLNSQALYNELFTAVQEKVAAAAILPSDNLFFDIYIKDDTIDDDDSLYLLCANIIAANLLVGVNRDREMRLRVPPQLRTGTLFGNICLRDMVNKTMICDRVGGMVRINEDEVFII